MNNKIELITKGYPSYNTPNFAKENPNKTHLLDILNNQINYKPIGENFIELKIPFKIDNKTVNLNIIISDKKIIMYEHDIDLTENGPKVINKNLKFFDKLENFKFEDLYKYINNYFKHKFNYKRKIINKKDMKTYKEELLKLIEKNYTSLLKTFNLTSKDNVPSIKKIFEVREYAHKFEYIKRVTDEERDALLELNTSFEKTKDNKGFIILYNFPKSDNYWNILSDALGITTNNKRKKLLGSKYTEKISVNKFNEKIYKIFKDLGIPVTKKMIQKLTNKNLLEYKPSFQENKNLIFDSLWG